MKSQKYELRCMTMTARILLLGVFSSVTAFASAEPIVIDHLFISPVGWQSSRKAISAFESSSIAPADFVSESTSHDNNRIVSPISGTITTSAGTLTVSNDHYRVVFPTALLGTTPHLHTISKGQTLSTVKDRNDAEVVLFVGSPSSQYGYPRFTRDGRLIIRSKKPIVAYSVTSGYLWSMAGPASDERANLLTPNAPPWFVDYQVITSVTNTNIDVKAGARIGVAGQDAKQSPFLSVQFSKEGGAGNRPILYAVYIERLTKQ